jgi:hypothetical protein
MFDFLKFSINISISKCGLILFLLLKVLKEIIESTNKSILASLSIHNNSGKEFIIKLPSNFIFPHNLSVTKGITGCNNLYIVHKEYNSTVGVNGPSSYLEISIYQSQNLFHTNF